MDEIITEVQGYRKTEELKMIAYVDDVMACEETEENLERELVKWISKGVLEVRIRYKFGLKKILKINRNTK